MLRDRVKERGRKAEWQIAPMGGISSFTKSKDIFYEMPFREPYYYEVKYNRNPLAAILPLVIHDP